MGASAGAAERLIAAVPQHVAILEASGTRAWGSLKGADGAKFTAHRQRAKVENCGTEWGLSNNLHGAGGNPRGGVRGTHGGSWVAAIKPNCLADPTLQIEVRQPVGIGSP